MAAAAMVGREYCPQLSQWNVCLLGGDSRVTGNEVLQKLGHNGDDVPIPHGNVLTIVSACVCVCLGVLSLLLFHLLGEFKCSDH